MTIGGAGTGLGLPDVVVVLPDDVTLPLETLPLVDELVDDDVDALVDELVDDDVLPPLVDVLLPPVDVLPPLVDDVEEITIVPLDPPPPKPPPPKPPAKKPPPPKPPDPPITIGTAPPPPS